MSGQTGSQNDGEMATGVVEPVCAPRPQSSVLVNHCEIGPNLILKNPSNVSDSDQTPNLISFIIDSRRKRPCSSRWCAYRVLLVDDHASVREVLRAILEGYRDLAIIGEAANGREAVSMAAALKPDVIVMDVNDYAIGSD